MVDLTCVVRQDGLTVNVMVINACTCCISILLSSLNIRRGPSNRMNDYRWVGSSSLSKVQGGKNRSSLKLKFLSAQPRKPAYRSEY